MEYFSRFVLVCQKIARFDLGTLWKRILGIKTVEWSSGGLNSTGAALVNGSGNLVLSWTRAAHNFGQQMLNVSGKHTPEPCWTLDPMADYVLLEGAWDACHCAMFGPLPEGSPGYELLRQPKYSDIIECEPTVNIT